MKGFLSLLAVVLCVQGFAQGPPAKAAYLFNVSLGTWVADTTTTDAGAGDLPNAPPAAALYCLNTATNQWTPATTSGNCFGSGSGGDTITSPNSTLNVGGSSSATTLDLVGAAGKIMAGAVPALTEHPVLGDSTTSG